METTKKQECRHRFGLFFKFWKNVFFFEYFVVIMQSAQVISNSEGFFARFEFD